MKWIHAINDYKDYLKIERGLSDNSIISYENDLKKLQDILVDIESDKLSLEESIEKYKEGVELSKKCQKALEDAKQIIKVLDNEK